MRFSEYSDMTTNTSPTFEFDGFRLDSGKRILFRQDGEAVRLMPKAYETLLYLVQNAGRVVEKDELMDSVWAGTVVEENNLNQNISLLRGVFGEKRGENRYIATIPGRGYEFVAAVTRVEASQRSLETPSPEQLGARDGLSVRKPLVIALAIMVALIAGSLLWARFSRDDQVRSIAVLPFRPLVAENRDEVLELGMADTLIAHLSRSSQSVVLPLSSVRKYGGLNQDSMQAGRELGTDAVLEGNIQRWGTKIRVNVRLIRVEDGAAVWSGTFDEDFKDIFSVQEAISRRVVSEMVVQSGGEPAIGKDQGTTNATAYEYFLKGRYHVFKITRTDNQKAISYFEKAIELDPAYALAYAGLADAFRTQSIAAFAPSNQACPKAELYAQKALEIDPTLTDAHVVKGWVELLYHWNPSQAESNFKRALELSPNDSEAHRAYGHLLSNLGRHDEAVREGARASELAPLTLITLTLEGYFLMYAGRYDEATTRLGRAIDLDPNFWAAWAALGRVRTAQGNYGEAVEALRRARDLAGDGSLEPTTQLAYALGKAGRRGDALALIDELRSLSERSFVPSYFLAVAYNGVGDKENVLRHLEAACKAREVQMVFLTIDNRWDWLRSDPRFARLTDQMGLSQT